MLIRFLFFFYFLEIFLRSQTFPVGPFDYSFRTATSLVSRKLDLMKHEGSTRKNDLEDFLKMISIKKKNSLFGMCTTFWLLISVTTGENGELEK